MDADLIFLSLSNQPSHTTDIVSLYAQVNHRKNAIYSQQVFFNDLKNKTYMFFTVFWRFK